MGLRLFLYECFNSIFVSAQESQLCCKSFLGPSVFHHGSNSLNWLWVEMGSSCQFDCLCWFAYWQNRYLVLPNPTSSSEHPVRGSAWKKWGRKAGPLPLSGCMLKEARLWGSIEHWLKNKPLSQWLVPISSYEVLCVRNHNLCDVLKKKSPQKGLLFLIKHNSSSYF